MATVQWAFQGGGFRALAVDAGVVAALLRRAQRRTGARGTLKDLFASSDMLSTVSGSTWFMSSLIYSNSFASMIEEMGDDSGKSAGKLFGEQWTNKLLAINDGNCQLVQAVEKLMSAEGEDALAGAIEDLVAVDAWAKQGFKWQNFVEIFMSATVGITNEIRLGDPSRQKTWSAGKVFLIDHGMVTPSAHTNSKTMIWKERDGPGKISYCCTSEETLPRAVPAAFSIRVGQKDAKAPKAYINEDARRSLGSLSYSALVADSCFCSCCPCPATAKADEHAIVGNLEDDAASLSVIGCSAASSDAPGAISAYSKVPSCCYSCETFRTDLVSRATSAEASNAFSDADGLLEELSKVGRVTHQALEACQQKAFRSLVDGGDPDGTGIAFAIGAGAKYISAVLNFGTDGKSSYERPTGLTRLFQGASDLTPSQQVLDPVFKTPSAQQVQDAYSGPEFKEVKGSKYLEGIRVGIINATTCRNKWFGIDEGIDVQLLIVSVGTTVSLGELVDFHDYNGLVQEIVDALNLVQEGDEFDGLLTMLLKRELIERPVLLGNACAATKH